jgi:hypothetical protein
LEMETGPFLFRENPSESPATFFQRHRLMRRIVIISLLCFGFVVIVGNHLTSDATKVVKDVSVSDDVSLLLKKISQSNAFCEVRCYAMMFPAIVVEILTLFNKTSEPSCNCRNPLIPWRPSSGSEYGESWERAMERNIALARNAKSHLDVVLLGDSITEHWMGTELGEPDPNEQENAAVFQDFFSGGKIESLALGIAGDRVRGKKRIRVSEFSRMKQL